MSIGKITKPINNHHLVFGLAPRINAAGRMDSPDYALDVLMENDLNKALTKASVLQTHNTERKNIDQDISAEAIATILNQQDLLNKKTIVLFNEHWHKGVLGIIASRLVEYFINQALFYVV